jgi:magnesium-transporting ATPase (P-type)
MIEAESKEGTTIMSMSKSSKIVLGALTFLPIVLFTAYFVWMMYMLSDIIPVSESGHLPVDVSVSFLLPMFVLIGLGSVVSLGLLIYYIIHITRNPRFQKPGDNNKLVWILLVIFAGIVGQLVYFFMEIWPDRSNPHPDLIDQMPPA